MKDMVFNASKDKEDTIRSASIHQIWHFGQDEALKKLKEIAETDDYSFIRVTDKVQVFPIRDEAKKEIERLQNKGKAKKP